MASKLHWITLSACRRWLPWRHPCFSAQEAWPGIKPDVLAGFQQQLSEDFQRTVERFLALQTMGTETARQDTRTLKQTVLSCRCRTLGCSTGAGDPETADLRERLIALTMPHLRIYGYLDGLVPRKVVPLLDALWPSESWSLPKRHTRRLSLIPPSFAQRSAH